MTPKHQKNFISKVITMHSLGSKGQNVPQRIAIPMANAVEVLRVADILFFKSDSNYTHIHLQDGRHIIASMTLKLFEDHLKGGDFLRVHNRYLVNGKYISSYLQGVNKIKLICQKQIPVSRNKKTVLQDYLRSFMIQTS